MEFKLLVILALFAILDIKRKRISNLLTTALIATGLMYSCSVGKVGFSIAGIITGIMIVYAFRQLKIQRLGGADAKIFAGIGAFLGWQAVLAVYGIAFILSMPCCRKRYAYVPFMAMATLVLMILKG